MKRITILLSIVILLSLCACEKATDNTSSSEITSIPTQIKTESSSALESNDDTEMGADIDNTQSKTTSLAHSTVPVESSLAETSKPEETTVPSANKTTLETTNSTETNINKITDDAFGSYSLALIETDPNSPIACVGDLNLYGLYITSNTAQNTFFSNIAAKPESPDELIGLAPSEYYTYNGEKYVILFEGGFDPNNFKNSGTSIINSTIDLESGLITLSLSQNSEPLILQYSFENGTHKLIAQNSYVENMGGINATLIPAGSVFTKN